MELKRVLIKKKTIEKKIYFDKKRRKILLNRKNMIFGNLFYVYLYRI